MSEDTGVQYYIYKLDEKDEVWKLFAGPYDNWPGEVAEQEFRDSDGQEEFDILELPANQWPPEVWQR